MGNRRRHFLFIFILLRTLYSSNACWMEGVNNWIIPQGATILDTYRGIVFNRTISNVESIIGVTFWEGLNSGPYLTASIADSYFLITTNDAYVDYEEYETHNSISVTVTLGCTGGSSQSVMFVVEVEDTNNNAPQFLPSAELDYTIFTPLPPGSIITGCFDGITVRDIDLTTYSMNFAIEENPYFEIIYDEDASSVDKVFIGVMKTTSFIRSLPEPITLRISATDVDRTNDPRQTTTATVTIRADTQFELPEEPVFTQTYYFADYNDNGQDILTEPISLRSGFDDFVQFSLDGEFSNNFRLIPNGNQISLSVVTPLPVNVLRDKQILLVLKAEREYTSGASATIVVRLPEVVPLEFERNYYEGTIENNTLQVMTLRLTQGYEGEDISAYIFGEYRSHFTAIIQENIITLLMEPLSDIVINENNLIVIEVVASTEFNSARTVVNLEIIKDDNVTPVLNKSIYKGSYNTNIGLTLEEISFDQGYDDTVELSLEGEHENLFTITQGPTVTLATAGIIPPEIFSQQRILLTLHANKPRTVGASAVIDISLPEATQLSFEESIYRGTLQDNVLSLKPIVLSAGFEENVWFSITGEYAHYFTLITVQNQVTINLITAIPETIIQENDMIILTVEAFGLNAVPTTTSVLLNIVKEDITTPVFRNNIYYGTYQGTMGVIIENINLVQGFGDDVSFSLRGEHVEYFDIITTGNNVEVSAIFTIPEEVIYHEKVFVFNLVANKPLAVGANAAVVIRFPSELTDPGVMTFTQNTYNGIIENNNLSADDIILSTGYQLGTEFSLIGDNYVSYFAISNVENVVSISLINQLPMNEIESKFIVLDVEATRERAISVRSSYIIEIIKEEVEPLIFSKPYYQGVYNEEQEVLTFEEITFALGYDDTVTIVLEGEHASLFLLSETAVNSFTITLVAPIPNDIMENNSNIIFTISAAKPNSINAHAAISINIEREHTEGLILGFDRVTYVGSIQSAEVNLDPITLIEGYTNDVIFTLQGDLASYFVLQSQEGGVLSVILPAAIPDQMIPSSRLIVLDIRASAPQALTAHATIVFEVIVDDDVPSVPQLVFDSTYYTGSYTDAAGVTLDTPITLAQGYDQNVNFALEGDHAQWFDVEQAGNSVTLIVSSSIPSGVIANNHQLVFVILAQRPGSDTARATIVISLTEEHTKGLILGFDRVTYVGSIQSTEVNLDPITLIEGYTNDVIFTLQGDLASYFVLQSQGGGVLSVILPAAIPDQMIPSNRLIVLDIRASAPQALAAHATIVFEVIQDDDVPSVPLLVFDSTYYTGSYTDAAGVTLDTPITIAQGYDQNVNFALEGDHAQWFDVEQAGNSLTLIVSSSIPSGVIANNHQLVFVILAQRPGSDIARATIVISLTEEHTEGLILGFDRVTYVGSIQSTEVNLDPITLIEGYTNDVIFTLQGDLASYFVLQSQGGGVLSVILPAAIPGQMIPSNRLIVLDIRASAPQALAAHATIVFEVILDADVPSVPQLLFDSTYYIGSYTDAAGVTLDTPITLAQGYDQNVNFTLEGDHAQWFDVEQAGNSLTLIVSSSIPSGVIANNHQLVFVILAQRPGSDTTRATIVISLTEEHTEGLILGFDRVTYVGSIQSTEVNLDPITLIEGYTNDVIFTLQGDLASYFVLQSQGGGVLSVILPAAIPDQMIPSNRLIVLDIRASAPQALAAHATIVFEVILDDDVPSVPLLVFDSTYYTGSYTDAAGVTLDTPITLAQGYDQNVNFALEGNHAQWFDVEQAGNSLTLIVSSSIPSGVIANNHQLVFVILAQRPGSDIARATIVISLTEEHTEGLILGFDRVTYVGSIQSTEVNLDPITLIEGYTNDVIFTLQGDLASYFVLQSQGGGVLSVILPAAMTDQMIPSNRLIVLDIRASAPQALAAHATIVFEVILDDDVPSVPQLLFDSTYYTGSYTDAAGVTLDTPITLAQGYDQNVNFTLEGDHAQWFDVEQAGNSLTLIVSSSIPSGVIANNHQLVFVILAQRPGSDIARATIVISLTEEHTEGLILGFDRVTYVGSIQSTEVNLDPITLIEGYTNDVIFTLQGDLVSYFVLQSQGGGVLSVILPAAIPEQMIPSNRLIVLDIRASAPQALAAHATIVFEVILDDDVPSVPLLVFDSTYYTGSYTDAAGVTLDTPITLAQGYDQNVNFALEGDHAQWFDVEQAGNSVTLIVSSSIPSGVIANNHQLVFVILAQRPGSDTARATIMISLTEEHTEGLILGFDRVTYVGSIQSTEVNLDPITLIEGYTNDVIFTLQGDLASYFVLQSQGGGVLSVILPAAIPDQMLPSSRLIVLDIRASAPQALAAHATIVFEVILDDDVPSVPLLVFDSTYYTGSYTDAAGVTLDTPITLAQGYDQNVNFALEGDHAQWFDVEQAGNSVTLIVSSSIPSGVIANNHQLVFVILAQRPGSDTARATIMISLTEEHTEGLILGFDRVTYVGSIQSTEVNLDPITLIEGYTNDVIFTLQGDLASYFVLQSQGGGVLSVILPAAIPDQMLPSSRLIVLDIRASAPQALAAHATIVFEVILDDDVPSVPLLVFDSTYYTGSYTDAAGVTLDTPITLVQGYDQNVNFALEGDHAQWFDVEQAGNSLTLIVSSSIPSGVIANNHQLVFVILAQRPGSDIARATIVISLTEEHTEGLILGFDRVTYVGSIQSTEVNLDPITLIEGYTNDVIFTLQGDLASYFVLQSQGGGVLSVILPAAIPDQMIPSNRLIVLDIRASAPQALAAHATIVFEVILDDDVPSVPLLVFDSTYYTGSYTDAAGVTLDTPITLAQGYDQNVNFALEGNHAQWFDVEQAGNSLTLIVSSSIPSGVIANNHQLVFVILAQRPGSDIARATIVISLTEEHTEGLILGFDRVTYVGSIQSTEVNLDPITLIEGYTNDVIFTLQGDLANYFVLQSQGGGVLSVILPAAIPDQMIPSNRLIVLDIRASAPQALAAHATIVFEVILDDDVPSVPLLVFDSTYYTGSYTDAAGVTLDTPITLAQGYDQNVNFALEGNHAQWFDVEQAGNSLTLIVSSSIPSGVIANNHQLVFVILAQRPGSDIARATIVISLTEEHTEGLILGFDRVTYVGSIQSTEVNLDPITLIEGYTNDVIFTLQGDLASYFVLQSQGGGVLSVILPAAIPDQMLPSSRLIVLDIRASAPQALAAHATIVFEVILDDDVPSVPLLVFDSTYYTGSYTDAAGVTLDTPITLVQGYDQNVNFALEGDHAQWFDMEQAGNSLTLIVSSSIPSGVIANNHQLVFVILAQRPGSDIARATIVISLTEEHTEGLILGFDRVTYVGSIQSTEVNLDPITLIEGYTNDVIFTLQGDLASYFVLQSQGGGVLSVILPAAIPDQMIPSNRLIVLDIRASAPQALAAHATIVFEVILDDDVPSVPLLVFDSTYYTGSYTDAAGVTLDTPITLAQGYDQNVNFALEGNHAQWFDVEQAGNSLTLIVSSSIPSGVIANNHQLVFVILAQRPGSDIARATIVISLTEEHTEGLILGFDRVTYVGSIQSTEVNLDPITLIEGYTNDVIFTLQGDLANYFVLQSQGGGVLSVILPAAIPDQMIPSNRLIVLDIRASAPQALAAHATIVFEVILDDDVPSVPLLVFDSTYYTGSYTDAAGVTLDTPITLAQGYDQNVNFALEGNHAQWFDVEQAGNSLTLIVSSSIPSGVIANNHQLVFVILAQRPGSDIARATIVISLTEEHTEGLILGFDRVTYVGSIQSTEVNLDPITLIEGYTNDVIFTLQGDLASYFVLQSQGGGVLSVILPAAIPDQMIPSNRLIVLDIRASAPQALAAHATIVFEVILDDDVPSVPLLVFDSTYYTGSYTDAAGVTLDTPITLAQGYDQNVNFALEGNHAQWFDVEQAGNSLTLIVSSSIPSGVIANNHQLVFVILAQRPGSDIARATIVISLTEEHTEGLILGFDRVTYVGSIQSTEVNLDPITLIEGYTNDVIFTLQGDLVSYFVLQSQGGGVLSVILPAAIPEQMIPSNRLIVLDIRASAPQALAAHATIVFEVILDDDVPSVPLLVFDSTYYTGSYTDAAGVTLDTPITLAQGYDQNVNFALEGDHAQWFDVEQAGNSVTLIVSSSIPSGVIANNHQLVFVILAQRPGSDTARATIMISLTEEHTEGLILGFDRVTYVGSIQSTEVNLDPITLIEGYTNDVIFTLQGDLASYFVLQSQGGGVLSVILPAAIPDQMLPSSRLIVLDIRASAPQALAAHATIVFEVILDDDVPSVPLLVFDSTYYTGSYTDAAGVTLDTPITLVQGYDQNVNFALEGDHAQWFDVEQAGNSVTLIVSSSIPSGVIANNHQLVFVILAQRPGSDTARATIMISLTEEHTEGLILGFDRVTYVGSIQSTEVNLDPITLIEGYTNDVIFTLQGDLASYFVLQSQGGGVLSVILPAAIPDQMLPSSRLIVLDIRASAPQALAAHATIVFEVILDDDVPSVPLLVFDSTYYTGSYTDAAGVTLDTPITLVQGYDQNVNFALEGDHAQWFDVEQAGNSLTLIVSSSIPSGVIANNHQLVFVILAQRPGSDIARATIVISLTEEHTEGLILGFDRVTYVGSIQSTEVNLDPITLIERYTNDVIFTLQGDLASYFVLQSQGGGVLSVILPAAIPDQMIPSNRLIVLDIRASAPQALAAHATIVFEVILDDDVPSVPQLLFDSTYYTGSYTDAAGVTLDTPITLAQGYDQNVNFALEGDHAQWFDVVQAGNSVTLVVSSSIPSGVIANNHQLVFVIMAQRPGSDTARATVVILLNEDLQVGEDVFFDKLIYEGIVQLGTVQHEAIRVSNYYGDSVHLNGEYSSLFVGRVIDGVVTVQASGSLNLPDDITHVTLEMHASDASAVLLLEVVQTDVPNLPSVTFSSPSYVVNVDVAHTGLVGRVLATADNDEAIIYSISVDNAHLQTRMSINNDGELYLSAPANSGVYTFQVIATTVITRAEGMAAVYLTIEAVIVCGDNEIVVPPLIILDRDEEEPHQNLVILDTNQLEICHFTLSNRWPHEQDWLYVDEYGLHARSIDREHESIAFMALSQVQVELVLHCENDSTTRTKRSQRTDWLGPYDYGTSKWILTESIPYNSRRSLVNLIVNDINDNAPIFIGKELEPIVVGYPIRELEERILPRSLAELQATDADIGENAALRYWTSEDVISVAPITGFVHVRTGAQLVNNQIVTVSATDRNGGGLTGNIQLLVRLLDLNNIAMVTMRDAYLDDEANILAQLSEAVGYEVKVLRSVVVSDDLIQDIDELSRTQRKTSMARTSLLLYVYGLTQGEPVLVDSLITDINNNAAMVNVIQTIALEDYIEQEIISERDIGFMIATIVLSVILFIIIVLICLWFFLRWRRDKNYDKFSEESTLASRSGSVDQLPKSDAPRPRLNLEDLKRSEKRLQDMLSAPIEQVTVEPVAVNREVPLESIIDLSPVEHNAPIVIQSIDKLKTSDDTDEDEFGEVSGTRRKSVVTFNENVEKIIHVEDNDEDADTTSSQSNYEIYKL